MQISHFFNPNDFVLALKYRWNYLFLRTDMCVYLNWFMVLCNEYISYQVGNGKQLYICLLLFMKLLGMTHHTGKWVPKNTWDNSSCFAHTFAHTSDETSIELKKNSYFVKISKVQFDFLKHLSYQDNHSRICFAV